MRLTLGAVHKTLFAFIDSCRKLMCVQPFVQLTVTMQGSATWAWSSSCTWHCDRISSQRRHMNFLTQSSTGY